MLAELIAAGTLLTATAANRDAGFAGTRILIIESNRQSAIGLVLNRPLPGSKDEFAGGPVASPPFYLFQCKEAAAGARRLAPDLCVSSSKRPMDARMVKVIRGYTGWTAAQLQDEMRRGLWKARAAKAEDALGADSRR